MPKASSGRGAACGPAAGALCRANPMPPVASFPGLDALAPDAVTTGAKFSGLQFSFPSTTGPEDVAVGRGAPVISHNNNKSKTKSQASHTLDV